MGLNTLEVAKARRLLGRETGTLVVDAHAGLDPDAFGATVGSVRGGGLLLLLTPVLDHWPEFPDPQHARIVPLPDEPRIESSRFLRRLVRVLRGSQDVIIVCEGVGISAAEWIRTRDFTSGPFSAVHDLDAECRTLDQQQAVEAILRTATGHPRRPAVLVSDRGRGKSAALGIAAARLLTRTTQRIVITAPRLTTAMPALEHAARLLPGSHTDRGKLRMGAAEFEFVAPDALCLAPRPAVLVLVDEAAAIPAVILERLLRQYPRIAFATTVHGYEGTGRGFAVRFRRTLDSLTPGWNQIELATPIRWAPGDPVERLAFRALLMNADPAPEATLADAAPERCDFRLLDRDHLVRDDKTLGELFGLLVLAHYQTSPLDLKHLLDGPDVSVFTLCHRNHVAATALTVDEGGLDIALAHQVYMGKRRLRGHLLPQTLSQHLGMENAPRLRGRRIMRIAVHPALQSRGLGSRLLRELVASADAAGLDYIGSSFGADTGLLRFWSRAGFDAVRVGVRRDAASGAHSTAVMQALSAAGQDLLDAARDRFQIQLPHMLADALRDLEPSLAAPLLRRAEAFPELDLDAQDWRDLAAFAFGLRVYEVCPAPIWHLACFALAQPEDNTPLEARERLVLVAKVLQKRGWKEVAELLGLPGRKAAIEALRLTLRGLLLHYGGDSIRPEIEPRNRS
jgi:tRNA(Met) cytidine acetyltransferase